MKIIFKYLLTLTYLFFGILTLFLGISLLFIHLKYTDGFIDIVILLTSNLLIVFIGLFSFYWAYSSFKQNSFSPIKIKLLNQVSSPILMVALLVISFLIMNPLIEKRQSADNLAAIENGFNSYKEQKEAKKLGLDSQKELDAVKDTLLREKEINTLIKQYKSKKISFMRYDKATTDLLIERDFKENPELTKIILDEIISTEPNTSKRALVENSYIEHGVLNSQLQSIINKSECQKVFNRYLKEQQQIYKNETSRWNDLTLQNYSNSFAIDNERRYRDKINKIYGQRMIDSANKFKKCTDDIAKTIPNKLKR